ncbi:perforin-1-like [Denticeps clupeoides]|uniref:Perforin-1-like n=1 Tax=Denticeps clupeoides TaxID=299321 RepID=A0AAY4CDA0_9TELE|nr:perforin-1-like [Denticeps clupeoides]
MLWSLIPVWTVILSLPLRSQQSCYCGTEGECKAADFIPGSNLGGEGFDITTMERKGSYVINVNEWRLQNNSCNLCKNPYLQQTQKLPVSLVDWRALHKCSMKVSSSVYRSSESLLNSMCTSVENNWQIGLGFGKLNNKGNLLLAGTHSKLASYTMEKTKSDKFAFSSQKVFCTYYSYRLSNKPLLSPDFESAFKSLPPNYNSQTKDKYQSFIDHFGTHYITTVKLGGVVESYTSIKECEASLKGLNTEEIKNCLSAEASMSVQYKADADLNALLKHCNAVMKHNGGMTSFSRSFSDRFTEITGGQTTTGDLLFSAEKDASAYREWLATIPRAPDLVSYSLVPLHKLLPDSSPVQVLLHDAIKDYILQQGLLRNCSKPCQNGKASTNEPCVCQCHNVNGVNRECCPTQPTLARVILTVQKAKNLYGDKLSQSDAYVQIYDSKRIKVARSPVIKNNDNPVWNYIFDSGEIILSSTPYFELEVWDEDGGYDDDKLGPACNVKLQQGTRRGMCDLDHGMLFYKVQVTCGPSLSGPTCAEYEGSPMNKELEKVYVSRNARPIPKEMLSQMGVVGVK